MKKTMKKTMKMLLGFLLVVMFSGMFSPITVLAKRAEDIPMNKTPLIPYDKKWEKEVKKAQKQLKAKGVKLPWKKFESRKRVKQEDLAYIFYHAYKDTIPVEDPWSTGAIYNVREGSKYWKEIHWAVDVELLFLAYPDPFSGREPEEFLFRRQLYMSSGDVFFYFKRISKKLGVEKLPKKKKIFKFNDVSDNAGGLLFDDMTLYPEDQGHPTLIEMIEAGVATKRVDGSIGYYENATQGDLVVYLNRFMNLDLRLCPLEYQKKMTE